MTNYIAALVDELYRLGVRDVVISPGSRSTPLAILFCEHNFNVYVDIDERSASFFALGIAKEKEKPAVLVCTSGSAVAHYFPAIVEAGSSRVPLIVLTADRPHELRQVGAPQAIDQIKIYGGYVRYFEELALPEEREEMYRYVRVVMQKAYASVMGKEHGVAHINVPLRDPLVPDLNELNFAAGRSAEVFAAVRGENNAVPFDAAILQGKKGLILCGGDAYSDYQQAVLDLARRLKAPILADPLSNLRNYADKLVIDSYDAFLRDDRIKEELKPDFVLHFGQIPVSKRVQQFLARYKETLYIQVGEVFAYRNPLLSTRRFVVAAPKTFADSIQIENSDTEYADLWRKYQVRMRHILNSAREEQVLFEGNVIQTLQGLLPEQSRLVIANSMPIRDIDYFFAAADQNVKLLCNRGANGIDGTVSTALGVATAGFPTVLLTGDLAFYHDLNGLLIGKTHGLNLVIVLLNNDGGGIFRYLPQSKAKNFKYLFLTSHGMDFAGLETLYGLHYRRPQTIGEFTRDFQAAVARKGIHLIEVRTDLEESKTLHDKYTAWKM